MSKLRIAHIIVQPVLVWDDGEELSAGPETKPQAVPVSKVPELLAALPGEVARLEAELTAKDEHPKPETGNQS